MSKNDEWLDEANPVEQCESCPQPDGCIRECIIEAHILEDVARIRNEVVE